MKNQKGFTLVELLVVIAIIGILAAIAVPRFASATETANVATFESHHKTIVGAIALAIANTGGKIPTVDQVNANLPGNLKLGGTGATTANGKPAGSTYAYVPTTTDGVLTSTLTANEAVKVKYTGGIMTYSVKDGDTTTLVVTTP